MPLSDKDSSQNSPGSHLTIVDYEDLQRLDDHTLQLLSAAFVGTGAFGVVGIRGVPGYSESRKGAFINAAHLAVHDSEARQSFSGVRQTYPGTKLDVYLDVSESKAHFLSLSLTHTQLLSLPLSLSLSTPIYHESKLTHTHTHSHSLTHTHTHRITLN
jgi:hypothetical protein